MPPAPRSVRSPRGAALAVGASAALAAGQSGVSGDPATVALYRSAVHTTNALPAYIQRQSGYVEISDSLGPKRVVHWAWGWDQFQKGFHPATERILLVQHHGRVAWIEDVLSASSKNCHSPSCRKALPIELLLTPDHGLRRAHLVGERRVVLRPGVRPQHVPYAAGFPWWTTAGDYEPAQQQGR